ncbi:MULTISPECIES: S16 family serine protease [unclassified Lysinibacillus]|uniref:S16 family serine protease n=1 Tax=unclassified Lysinibacillus TaxID=2636778 RepID=UPI001F0D27DB|nr:MULTISPECIES: S16 family serine protease [unclassified Lysinibacillus]
MINENLKFVIQLLLPIIFYVVGLVAYYVDIINLAIFMVFILVAFIISIACVFYYRNRKKQKMIFTAITILMLLLSLFEFRLLAYEFTTFIVTSYNEPLEVVDNSGIHVLAVHETEIQHFKDLGYMIHSVEQLQNREVLDYVEVTNRMRYHSKNIQLLSYITPSKNYFNKMKGNVITYLNFESKNLEKFFNRDDIEGDSAGLALALSGLIEKKELHNNRPVAVTGAIDGFGNVMEIGSIKAKILIAEKYHLPYIILPVENATEAQKVKSEQNLNIEIIAVEHVDEAVSEIERIQTVK